jgi:hypothetical protein
VIRKWPRPPMVGRIATKGYIQIPPFLQAPSLGIWDPPSRPPWEAPEEGSEPLPPPRDARPVVAVETLTVYNARSSPKVPAEAPSVPSFARLPLLFRHLPHRLLCRVRPRRPCVGSVVPVRGSGAGGAWKRDGRVPARSAPCRTGNDSQANRERYRDRRRAREAAAGSRSGPGHDGPPPGGIPSIKGSRGRRRVVQNLRIGGTGPPGREDSGRGRAEPLASWAAPFPRPARTIRPGERRDGEDGLPDTRGAGGGRYARGGRPDPWPERVASGRRVPGLRSGFSRRENGPHKDIPGAGHADPASVSAGDRAAARTARRLRDRVRPSSQLTMDRRIGM